MKKTYTLAMSDGCPLSLTLWEPEGTIRALLYVVHGMVEHISRYEPLAQYLNSQGILVVGDDHRGHGLSHTTGSPIFYANEHGWQRILKDLEEVLTHVTTKYTVPCFIFGHSMGSYMTRCYLANHSDAFDGAIICGTGQPPLPLTLTALGLSHIRYYFSGNTKEDVFLSQLAFGNYNNRFQPATTPFEWLSSRSDQVQKYMDDPMCGGIPTAGFWKDFLGGIKTATSKATFKLDPELPLLLIGGEEDPVGDYGKAIPKIAKLYKQQGSKEVNYKLYKACRHEILNDVCREEVSQDILHFIEMHNF
mgnify:CR=1 FL=1